MSAKQWQRGAAQRHSDLRVILADSDALLWPSSLAKKIRMVQSYISRTAKHEGIGVGEVPCPDPEQWSRLSLGKDPLPAEGQLPLFADDVLRELHGDLGLSWREVYFRVAIYEMLQSA